MGNGTSPKYLNSLIGPVDQKIFESASDGVSVMAMSMEITNLRAQPCNGTFSAPVQPSVASLEVICFPRTVEDTPVM